MVNPRSNCSAMPSRAHLTSPKKFFTVARKLSLMVCPSTSVLGTRFFRSISTRSTLTKNSSRSNRSINIIFHLLQKKLSIIVKSGRSSLVKDPRTLLRFFLDTGCPTGKELLLNLLQEFLKLILTPESLKVNLEYC